MPTVEYDIFISHNTETSTRLALAIKDLFATEKRSLNVFVASRSAHTSIPPHVDSWERFLQESLDQSKVVILLLTKSAYDSENVEKEIAMAVKGGKTITILCCDGFKPEDEKIKDSEVGKLCKRANPVPVETGFNPAHTAENAWPLIEMGLKDALDRKREKEVGGVGTARSDAVRGDSPEQLIKRIVSSVQAVGMDSDDAPEIWRIFVDMGRVVELLHPVDPLDRSPEEMWLVNLGQNAGQLEAGDREQLNNLETFSMLLRDVFDRPEDSDAIRQAWETLNYTATTSRRSYEPTVIIDMGGEDEDSTTTAREYTRRTLAARVNLNGGTRLVGTPILGTGVLQIRADDEPDSVHDEDSIAWDQSVEAHAAGDGGERNKKRVEFLERLIESRRDGRGFTKTVSSDTSVSAARTSLFDLAFASTQVFVKAFSEHPAGISDWQDHDVPICSDDLDALLGLCRESIASLEPLLPAGHARGVTVELFGAADLQVKLETLRAGLERERRLSGAAVEWMTDIFWHSMIFDSPMYPRMDELALQVSLIDASFGELKFSSPIRRLEPAASVPRFKLSSFEDSVRRSVERGFTPDYMEGREIRRSRRGKFYSALADVLAREYEEVIGSHSSSTNGSARTYPLAIVTTFDLEFERALATSKVWDKYHVALPVLVPSRGTTNRARLRWLIGTFPMRQAMIPALESLTEPMDGWMWLDDVKRRGDDDPNLCGPLILKVNGSPLHKLDARTLELLDEQPSNHAMSLGEFDIFQASRVHMWAESVRQTHTDGGGGQGLPPWLSQTMSRDDRYWMLLGHRLTDWNARMRLYLYLPDDLPAGRAIAVNRYFDQDRSRVLSWLNIKPVLGDAAELVPWFTDYAQRDQHQTVGSR